MKVRIAKNLPIIPLGKSSFHGKVLISLEDNVGFAMYEFNMKTGDEVELASFHEGHNHVYYCVNGRCSIHSDASEELAFTTDCMLALTAEKSVTVRVLEPARIVAVSVPRDPNLSPRPLLMKTLDEIVNSDRNVFFERGYSRRFLAAPDGYNLSFHNAWCFANNEMSLHYINNNEGVYIFSGRGEYVWNDGKEKHDYDSEKHDGTVFILEHDAHVVKSGADDILLICVFFPALKGTERLKFNQGSGSSY